MGLRASLHVRLRVRVLRTVESSLAGHCSSIHIGFKFNEQLDTLVVSVVGCLHERSLVMVCASVHIRALLQKYLHCPDMAGLGSQVQGGLLDCRRAMRNLVNPAAALQHNNIHAPASYILGRAGRSRYPA
jgi:hypothetical protein